MAQERHGVQYHPVEWAIPSSKVYRDPFNEVEVDVIFRGPGGQKWHVPAYWAGEQERHVRFAPPHVGTYQYRTTCSDTGNQDLHSQEGQLIVQPYQGNNPLFRSGPLRVSPDHRYLEHADGTPFFWLADTWWMALCRRLVWPYDFQLLVADRRAKGFTVIQLFAGLFPDMTAFDERGANEAGFPWEEDFARINPAYFDMADLRIHWLVRSGLVPCIFGMQGFHLPWMGLARVKQHWRYLIARWGAYPVVWCLCGEATLPYFRSPRKEEDAIAQRQGWTAIAAYVRATDPYRHPITIHPRPYTSSRTQAEDVQALDLEMLQGGHFGYREALQAPKQIREAVSNPEGMPVLMAEVCYEGMMGNCGPDVQRFLFWTSLLSGVAGYTYGANGIWQVNRRDEPFGLSTHGTSWSHTPWEEAYQLPGSRQVSLGKRLLERYPWWRFQPHQDWITPHATDDDPLGPYGAGIPGTVRVFYFPSALPPWGRRPTVQALEQGHAYHAFFFDPQTGQDFPIGPVQADATGTWQVPAPPILQDWVLVLEQGS